MSVKVEVHNQIIVKFLVEQNLRRLRAEISTVTDRRQRKHDTIYGRATFEINERFININSVASRAID